MVERLVGIAFSTIRIEGDNQRPPGVEHLGVLKAAFSPSTHADSVALWTKPDELPIEAGSP